MKLHLSHDFSLPVEAVTETFAILAKRGVGKTYTGAVMTEEMLKSNQQVVVLDPVGVWWGLRSAADGRGEGFPIVVFGGEHADVPLEESAGEVIASAIDDSREFVLDEVGERTQLSAGSGSFATYLGKLRTLELVTGSRQNLKASDELFD